MLRSSFDITGATFVPEKNVTFLGCTYIQKRELTVIQYCFVLLSEYHSLSGVKQECSSHSHEPAKHDTVKEEANLQLNADAQLKTVKREPDPCHTQSNHHIVSVKQERNLSSSEENRNFVKQQRLRSPNQDTGTVEVIDLTVDTEEEHPNVSLNAHPQLKTAKGEVNMSDLEVVSVKEEPNPSHTGGYLNCVKQQSSVSSTANLETLQRSRARKQGIGTLDIIDLTSDTEEGVRRIASEQGMYYSHTNVKTFQRAHLARCQDS